MEQEIDIRSCDLVLAGIGEELGEDYRELYQTAEYARWKEWGLEQYAKAIWLGRQRGTDSRRERIRKAYARLREMIGEKPYFIVSLNTDGYLYEAGFDPQQMVMPCGSMRMLQCSRHILEPEEAAPLLREMEEQAAAGRRPEIPVCPVCGEPLVCNVAGGEGYLEDAYLPMWQAYTRWLAATLNRRLCVLELGVGFAYPSVIRFPFEKTVYYNRKAYLYRVHGGFPQVPEKIGGRSMSIREDALEFLLREERDGR